MQLGNKTLRKASVKDAEGEGGKADPGLRPPRAAPREPEPAHVGQAAPPRALTPPGSAVRDWGWTRRPGTPHATPGSRVTLRPRGPSAPEDPSAPKDEFPLRGQQNQSQEPEPAARGGRLQAVSGHPVAGGSGAGREITALAWLSPRERLGKDGVCPLSQG